MAIRIQFRRGSAADWTTANPVLAAGELGYESDTGQIKLGNGTSAWTALSYGAVSEAYVDAAIAEVIGLAPSTLDTLNELAAALGDDENFASTVATSLSTKVNLTSKTTAEWVSDNTVLAAGEIGYMSDSGRIKVGDGTTTWNILHPLALTSEVGAVEDSVTAHVSDTLDVHGIADTSALATKTHAENFTTNALDSHNLDTTSVHGIPDTAALATKTYSDDAVSSHAADTTTHGVTTPVVGEDDAQTLTNKTISTVDNSITVVAADISDVTASAAELNTLDGITASVAELNILDGVTATAVELNYVDGVTSGIQTQLDAKLASATAASTYSPLAAPTFTGTVVLPSTTSIGDVSATELGYVNGVTSAIQTQIDTKAPLAAPTFTGDVVVSSTTAATSTTSAALVITGGLGTGDSAYIGGDLIISGDFTVNGTTTTVNATDLSITDPMIYIGEGNDANSADLGVVASFNDGTYQHAGIVRDSSDGKWKIFKGVTDEPTTTINFAQGSLDALAVGAFEATSATIGDVSNTELQYVNGVTSAIQTQIDAKLASATAATTYAPIAAPTFTGLTTVSASGIAYTDGTQTKEGVPSRTYIYGAANSNALTASATLSTLAYRDAVLEVNSGTATTMTIPPSSTTNYPIGTTIDILQVNTGQVTIAAGAGVTLNATPGLKLRTQWSSVTLLKRGTDTWVVFGDLTA